QWFAFARVRIIEEQTGRRGRRSEKGAGPNNVGCARGALRGCSREFFQIQRRPRLFKTRPSSRDSGEVNWPVFHVAKSSLRTAARISGRVDFHRVMASPSYPAARTIQGGYSSRGNSGLRFLRSEEHTSELQSLTN